MSFSSETIRKKTRSSEEYEKGRALFREGRVRLLSSESFWKGEETLKVLVDEDGQEYRVSLLIKGGCIYQASCQCPSHREYKGLCCHEAAAAFYAMEKKEEESTPHVPTGGAVKHMLQSYVGHEMTKVLVSKMEEPVCLIPVFRNVRQTLALSFRIGTGRLYQLRDLEAFADALEEEAYVEYGKQLGFYHTLDAFEETSARLAEETARTVAESRYLEERLNPLRTETRSVMRELELSPAGCDNFLKLLYGKEALFSFDGREELPLLIKKENPRLYGVIRACGRDGFRVSFPENFRVIYGKKRLYVAMGTTLYCCDRSASRALWEFFRAMTKDPAMEEWSIQLNAKDMPSFCDYVIPELSPFVDLEPLGVDLEQYHLEPLKPRFYFDCPGEDEVTLRAEFWYGKECFTPFDHPGFSEISRDQVGELMVGTVIKKYFTGRYADKSRFVIWDDDSAVYRLLTEGLEEFSGYGEVTLSPSMKNLTVLPKRELSFGVTMGNGWLEFNVDAGELSPAELSGALAAYRMKQSFYRTRSGAFLPVNGVGFGTLEELSRLTEQRMSASVRLPSYRSFFVDHVLRDGKHISFRGDDSFRNLVRAVSHPEEQEAIEVPKTLHGTLREYQRQGYVWLRTLDRYGLGGILADEMGLGKTIQVIALLADEAEKHPEMEALIVCPSSLLYNWESELHKFAPGLSVQVIAGTAEERKALLEQEHAQVSITSYDLLRRDIALYEEREFRFQILDEAQYIKNHLTQNARAVKKIRARGRFALTGTPMENRLSDLWSIFDFLMPGFLFSCSRFRREFEIPIVKDGDKAALKRLHRMTGPFLLRRYKKEVLRDLPDKLEEVVYSGMEPEQRKLYAAHALRLKEELESGGDAGYQKDRIKFLSELLRLRQICCDPSLCYEGYRGGSGKLDTCMELIESAVAAGHKILVFSQFTSMLEILGKRLEKAKLSYHLLTGQTGKEERIALVRSFNQDQVPLFLISLKAGGTGLNLTAADLVIHYDPWWNLAAENQATDRAHRIGQKKKVSVFRLIARDTIEEGVLKLQNQKRELEKQVTEGASSVADMSREELLSILTEESDGIHGSSL